ncbi:unnamed protein product, partial [Closterium sp. NIES-64]
MFHPVAAAAPGTRFHPVSLAFKNVTYTVTLGRGKAKTNKLILDNLTGYVKAGSFLAIMGPSGPGKTSLRNVLAGQVLVNGRPRSPNARSWAGAGEWTLRENKSAGRVGRSGHAHGRENVSGMAGASKLWENESAERAGRAGDASRRPHLSGGAGAGERAPKRREFQADFSVRDAGRSHVLHAHRLGDAAHRRHAAPTLLCSGKTSLLNVLAGRVMKSGAKTSLSGQVLVNGRPRDESFRRISAYVMQDDLMFSTLTVWETLQTAAMLRLPSTTPKAQRLQLAESIIAELGLSKARNTPIGNEMIRGVSGGERKRTNIAVEMLSNPSLVFLVCVLPSTTPKAQRLQLAESIIAELGLSKARNMPIGNEMIRGVSGGERKRTNIAVEMLSNPSLVFLDALRSCSDEPTSGLDSFQALNVMSALSDLSKSGRTVISTIHQPRSSIFALFENLLLLSEGRMHFNPADYFMDMISVDRRDEQRETDSTARIAELTSSYEPAREVRPDLHQKSMEEQAEATEGMKYSKYASSWGTQLAVLTKRSWLQGVKYSKYASSWGPQLAVLTKRSWLQVTRDRLPIAIAYVQAMVMMVMICILYSNTSAAPQQNMTGSLFFISLFLAFNGIFRGVRYPQPLLSPDLPVSPSIPILPDDHHLSAGEGNDDHHFPIGKGSGEPRVRASNTYRLTVYNPAKMITTFPLEKGVVNRERASNTYRVTAYYPAKVLSEWPIRIGPVIVFGIIAYWPIQYQRVASKFFLFLVICMLEFTAMNGLGILIGSIAPTPQLALAMGPLFTVIGSIAPTPQLALAMGPLFTVVLMLFGGFYVNLDSIPVWIRWVRYLSPIQWGFVGLAVNQFEGLTFSCSPGCPDGDQILKNLSIDNYT